jgi:hypothetical protein
VLFKPLLIGSRMTIQQFLLIVFAVLIIGLMLPLPSGARTALFLALIVVGVLTFIGGGMHYLLSQFH